MRWTPGIMCGNQPGAGGAVRKDERRGLAEGARDNRRGRSVGARENGKLPQDPSIRRAGDAHGWMKGGEPEHQIVKATTSNKGRVLAGPIERTAG